MTEATRISASGPTAGLDIEAAPDGTIFRHPDRVTPKKRPLAALMAFRKLIADKEDTSQVFKIFESLPSRGFVPSARAFTLSEQGLAIRESEGDLVALLDDHETLRQMPEGSVAHAYCDFMEREGLSAQGLVDEQEKNLAGRARYDDLIAWYMTRRRDTHDLLHVLTGYGRDALGEQCVLAFTYGQNGGLGNLFIAYLGALHIARIQKTQTDIKAPVLSAVRQAQRHGDGAPCIAEMSIRDLLARQLDEVRAQMGIGEPTAYLECHRTWRASGIDPYHLVEPKKAQMQPA